MGLGTCTRSRAKHCDARRERGAGTNVKTKTNVGRSPRRTRGKTSEAAPAVSPRRSNGLANPKITGHALGGKEKNEIFRASNLRSRGVGEGRGAGGRRRRLVLHVCTRFRARDARRTRSGSSSARSARSFVRVRGGRETVKAGGIRSAKKRKRFGARTTLSGAALRVDGSDARAATRAREQKDRTFRVGRLRPRTFSILSATTFWFALATVSRPIPFQSNAHSCLFACRWVAQKVYSHRHLNPVSPTRLLQAKHLPWFSCTGAAGAAASAGRATPPPPTRRPRRVSPRRASPPRGRASLLRLELLHQVAPRGRGRRRRLGRGLFLTGVRLVAHGTHVRGGRVPARGEGGGKGARGGKSARWHRARGRRGAVRSVRGKRGKGRAGGEEGGAGARVGREGGRRAARTPARDAARARRATAGDAPEEPTPRDAELLPCMTSSVACESVISPRVSFDLFLRSTPARVTRACLAWVRRLSSDASTGPRRRTRSAGGGGSCARAVRVTLAAAAPRAKR